MDNISPHCIICYNKKNLIELNGRVKDQTRVDDYTDLLYRCFGIQFLSCHRGKTHNICGKCTARLKYCCAFRKEVEAAHRRLYRTFNKNISKKDDGFYNIKKDDENNESTEFVNRRNSTEIQDVTEITHDSDSDVSTKTNEIFTSTGYFQELERVNRKEKHSIPPLENDCATCPICSESFDNRYRLKLHYDNHFPTYLCELCGQSYAKKETFIIHMKHHQGESYTCEHCQRTYMTKHSMKQHVRLAHLNEKLYTCLKCPVRFRAWQTRRKHMLKEHGVQCEIYKCPRCDETYIVKERMKAHLRRFHFKEKSYRCDMCSFASFTKFELKSHMLKHSGIKDHNCEYCGRAFSRRSGLKEHLKIHLNIKNYKCEYCDKAFVQKCALKGHVKVHQKI